MYCGKLSTSRNKIIKNIFMQPCFLFIVWPAEWYLGMDTVEILREMTRSSKKSGYQMFVLVLLKPHIALVCWKIVVYIACQICNSWCTVLEHRTLICLLCMCSCVLMCVHHACRDQRSTLHVILNCFVPLLLKQGLSLNLELIHSARLAFHITSGLLLSALTVLESQMLSAFLCM